MRSDHNSTPEPNAYDPSGLRATLADIDVDDSFSQVYDELRQLARRELRRGSLNTLHTTELVHETYVKLCRNNELAFGSDTKFFRYAAMAMRHILLDRAMRRVRVKFGGDGVHVNIDEFREDRGLARSSSLALQLDLALRELEKIDARAAKVVELHYFAGLSLARVGEIFGMHRRTVDRDWAFARAFLEAQISDEADLQD